MDKVYLILANGKVFEGTSIGAKGETVGEVVFCTSMTGYVETLTDPTYYGQIVCQTFPAIGNYGIMKEDFESDKMQVKGYIVRDLCDEPSNFRSQGKLDDLLKEQNIVGIAGIDTRQLTKIIRDEGAMNGIITSSPVLDDRQKKMLEEYSIKDAVASVSVKKPVSFKGAGKPKYKVAMMDYGTKRSYIGKLTKRGCEVMLFPCDTKAEDVLAIKPDGIMLSNGPGNPAEATFQIEQIKKMLKSDLPVLGICLGHQLLAIAHGAKTYKLKYGHMGNQPVKDLKSDRVYVSSVNHSYAVDADSLPSKVATVSFKNVNDGTCEGLDYANGKVFSVQFRPETCEGAMDTGYLYDRFIAKMEENK